MELEVHHAIHAKESLNIPPVFIRALALADTVAQRLKENHASASLIYQCINVHTNVSALSWLLECDMCAARVVCTISYS